MLSSLTSQTEATPSSSAEETSDTTPESTQPAGPTGSLSGYTVILDPGHGGKGAGEKTDRGCDYPYWSGQNEEPEFTLKIAELLSQELESRGATVYITHTDDEYYSLFYRCAFVHQTCLDIAKDRGILSLSAEREQELRNSLKKVQEVNSREFSNGGMGLMGGSGVGKDLNDLFEVEYQLKDVIFVSLHINSLFDQTDDGKYVPVTKQRGAQVYYITDDVANAYEERQKKKSNTEFQDPNFPIRDPYFGRYNDNNKLLANSIYNAIVEDIPDLKLRYDDPIKTDAFAVLREHGLVGCLVEFAFVTNDEDRAILQSEDKLREECSSVADGIEDYFAKMGNS